MTVQMLGQLCAISRHSFFREPRESPLIKWSNSVCHYKQIVRLMGGTSENYLERYRACDPSQLYDSSVRTFVIHGENDETVSVRQAQYYFQKAPETIQLEIWQDADHFSMLPHDGIWSTKQWTNLKATINTFFKTSF